VAALRGVGRLPLSAPYRGSRRVCLYLPDDGRDPPVILCAELPNNEGSSVTYSAHQIAAEVTRYHKLSIPVWIEHHPKEATDGTSETFELVVLSGHEVAEKAPYLEHTRLTIGEPTWKTLDHLAVETLVRQPVGTCYAGGPTKVARFRQ
jgi:hypothetical protein